MKAGTPVIYNGGEGKENTLALVRGGDSDKLDLVVFTRDGASWVNDVPRRDRADYGSEGGGHTWRPVA
jgi:hypothetical protein